ncbi:MAG: autoinducer binding domain-containing protein [Alphaproteobacteria bacterium]|nr:autoinducer binding domain-containing protein [Alphaproteobacteria bacterium SS10]
MIYGAAKTRLVGAEQLTAIELADSVEQVIRIFDRIAGNFGASSFSYVDIGSVAEAGAEPFFRTTVRTDFIESYLGENFLDYDPVVRRAAAAHNHFGWFDCPEFAAVRKPRPGPRQSAGRILDLANDFEFFDGIIVPVHHRDDQGQTHSALISLYFDEQEARRSMRERFSPEFHALIILAHQRIVELRGLAAEPRDVEGAKPASMIIGDRERRVLTLIAGDKSVQEAADILGVTRDAVNQHLKSARKRYGVKRTPAAVAQALVQGDIML